VDTLPKITKDKMFTIFSLVLSIFGVYNNNVKFQMFLL